LSSEDQLDFDKTTVESLEHAASQLLSTIDFLKAKRIIFVGTNLPVADAVNQVITCLERDVEHLERLAAICSESASAMKAVGGE
jgi:hypothetical protein